MEHVRSSLSIISGLPREKVGSAPATVFFEACSAFTHVTACTLAESLNDPLHRKLRQLCCLRCRFDCYRVERTSSQAGVHPLKSSAFHGALYRQLSRYLQNVRFRYALS